MKAVGTKHEVYHYIAHHTNSMLERSDLTENKDRKVVSRKKRAMGVRNNWPVAMKMARQELNITGFVTLGKGEEGDRLLSRTREIFAVLNEKRDKQKHITAKIQSHMNAAKKKKLDTKEKVA